MARKSNGLRKLEEILERMNPWWRDRYWYRRAVIEQVRDALTSHIRPRLLATVKEWLRAVRDEKGYGVRIIRGPRRVGKTTLIYLSVIEATDKLGFKPYSLVYITLDDPELHQVLKQVGLRDALVNVIDERLRELGYTVIFLDEVTFYPQWSLVLKRMYDEGSIRPGVLVIATGSYSLELAEAKSALEGRPGRLGRDSIVQRFYYPLRFSEVFESENLDAARKLYGYRLDGRKLAEKHARLTLIERMSLRDYPLDMVERVLSDLAAMVLDDLEATFKHVFLRTGGFAGAIVSLHRTGRVDDDHYRRVYELLLADAAKFGYERLAVEQLVRYLVKSVGASGFTNIHNVAKNVRLPHVKTKDGEDKRLSRQLKPEEARRLLSYLTDGTRMYFQLYRVRPPAGGEELELPDYDYDAPFKLTCVDPVMYYSLLAGVLGVQTGIEQAVVDAVIDDIEERRERAGPLLESIVCSHIVRLSLVKYSVDVNNYGYLGIDKEAGDCATWYLDKLRRRFVYVAVEAKLTAPAATEVCKLARKLSTILPETRLLIATMTDRVQTYECKGAEALHIPAPLLLALT